MTKFPNKKDLEYARKKLSKGMASRPLSKNANPVERVKHNLCEKFIIYMREKKISQRDLAEKLGINESLISKIIHYHFDEFTTDRLIKYLSKIYPGVDIKVNVA